MGMTYKKAGVDRRAVAAFLKKVRHRVGVTFGRESGQNIGKFAGLFPLNTTHFQNPVLVSGTDGVGTKLKVAFLMKKHDTVGIDLVAMCVNDVVVTGAAPLFFLDYLACGRLQPQKAGKILTGIIAGCRQAGCALLGGETAEMPGIYRDGEYDLAGFAVGVADRDRLIDGRRIRPGDVVVGLASSGLHSNGYSLARRVIFDKLRLSVSSRVKGLRRTIGEELLTPTRIYVRTVLTVIKESDIRGMAHITGGGITENLPRVLPKGCQATIDTHSWKVPFLFRFLQEKGGITEQEMFRTFNMGIGMILVVPSRQADRVISLSERSGEKACVIGEITRGTGKVVYA